MTQTPGSSHVRMAIDIAISLALVSLVLVWCLQILRPFASVLIWAAIISISLYKPFLLLRGYLGGRQKLAVALFAALGLATVLVPAWLFVGSVVETGAQFSANLESGEFHIAPPNESVKDWPVVGEKVFVQWSEAAENFSGWLEDNNQTVKAVTTALFSKLAGVGVGVLQFVISILIAAAMLANAEGIAAGMRRPFNRLMGDKADEMLTLTVSTVRSVTVGVLGIAFIQAVLGGLGMVVVGVPAAGVWALFILILAIAQLPPLLVLLPAIIYVFSIESGTTATLFAIWSIAVSFSDAVLKPLLLGRGVEAPMLVILLGAIGGMIMSGIVGLFVGAVVLAIGYTLMEAWLRSGETEAEDDQEERISAEG